jgi:hypothetical protein
MLRLASAVAVLMVAGTARGATNLTVHVRGGTTQIITSSCFLKLKQRVTGGGTLVYCLKTFHGKPGPNAVVRDSGVTTFTLPKGTILADVSIVQRFAADGAHAKQTLTGKVAGGTGRYAHARGSVSGGGTDVEQPPGSVRSSNLRYAFVLR